MVGVGRDLCGSSGPAPLPKQGHLQQATQDHVQAGLEYLQRMKKQLVFPRSENCLAMENCICSHNCTLQNLSRQLSRRKLYYLRRESFQISEVHGCLRSSWGGVNICVLTPNADVQLPLHAAVIPGDAMAVEQGARHAEPYHRATTGHLIQPASI